MATGIPGRWIDGGCNDAAVNDVVAAIVHAFNTGDVSTVDDVFALTYVDHQRPDWLDEDGPAEFKAIVDLARRGQPGVVVTVEGLVLRDGQMVAMRLRWLNAARERETIEVLRLDGDGRIAEHWGGVSIDRPR